MSEKIFLNDKQRDLIEELAKTLGCQRIADRLGISKNTLLRIFKEEPELLARYKKAKSKTAEQITKSLIQKALDGDTTALLFYLKTHEKWRQNTVKFNIKGVGDNPKDILQVIINQLAGNGDEVELDNQTLNTLNDLIKTKTTLDEVADIKERLDKLENA